jgi:tRNA-splicing ligase RtcB (3'-phosphate/5'-hydroxy nucleic acid ligase)
MYELLTKVGNHKVKKIRDFEFTLERDESLGMRVPVTIYADDNLLSKMLMDRTIHQAANVSTLPGICKHVVVLPDGHEGYGFPVGSVAATDFEEGVISPGGVGYDINCGVRLIRTNLLERDIKCGIKTLIDELFKAIPSGVGSEGASKLTRSDLDELLVEGAKSVISRGYGWTNDLEVCEEGGMMVGADPSAVSETAKKRGINQLGSLGSGNHFLEVQKVNKIFDDRATKAMGFEEEGQLAILVHCGSRGFGHQVCSDYLRISERALKKYDINIPDRELACVPNQSSEGKDYLKGMSCALNFAWSNREMITHWVRKTFERVLKLSENDLDMQVVYDVSHNVAKVESHRVDDKGICDLVVHRKGATRAFSLGMNEIPRKYRTLGQPVIIPGSMGTASWLLLGNPKSADLSFGSTAHGAGRAMSRSAAKRTYTVDSVRRILESKGIYIKSLTKDGIVEETPNAYKDVDSVVNVSHSLGIATKVTRLIPIGVMKG